MVHGPNAAGKTNLLEAAYLATTGRSPRGASDRELVRRGAQAGSAAVRLTDGVVMHETAVHVVPGVGRRSSVDGRPVESLLSRRERPLLSVFLPDRLALVQGGPGLRRAHLDQVLCALVPEAPEVRRTFHAALRQRGALLGAVRDGRARTDDLDAWDDAAARAGARLRILRQRTTAAVGPHVAAMAAAVGLGGTLALRYRASGDADADVERLRAELVARRAADVERGFTGLGPHRDDLVIERDGRPLRRAGSQGEQRLAVLALLLGEAEALATEVGRRPVLLLDDVLSELDVQRRTRLVEVLSGGGQALISTADPDQVPAVAASERTGEVVVEPGRAVVRRVATAAAP